MTSNRNEHFFSTTVFSCSFTWCYVLQLLALESTFQGWNSLTLPKPLLMCTILVWKCALLSQSQLSFVYKKSCDWLRGELLHAKIVHVQELGEHFKIAILIIFTFYHTPYKQIAPLGRTWKKLCIKHGRGFVPFYLRPLLPLERWVVWGLKKER